MTAAATAGETFGPTRCMAFLLLRKTNRMMPWCYSTRSRACPSKVAEASRVRRGEGGKPPGEGRLLVRRQPVQQACAEVVAPLLQAPEQVATPSGEPNADRALRG